MRYFQFSEGGSHKFWNVAVDGVTQTVRFGRIGTPGQEQIKTFESDGAAEEATARLIAAKLRKGYGEVSAETAARTPRRISWQQLLLPLEGDESPLPSVLSIPALSLDLF